MWNTPILLALGLLATTGISATPRRNSVFARAEDITRWLYYETNANDGIAFEGMMSNISPEGAAPGSVVSSTSRSSPVCCPFLEFFKKRSGLTAVHITGLLFPLAT